jgi:hypothetical protein
MTDEDRIEVFRKAHELGHSHGWNAHRYAAKLAAAALTEGDAEGHRFWTMVEAALRPREISS